MNFFKTLFRVEPVEGDDDKDIYAIVVKRSWSSRWEFHHGWYKTESEAQKAVNKLKAINKK